MGGNGRPARDNGGSSRAEALTEVPEHLDRPFFAYGTLKPDELGYELISGYVDSVEPATVTGHLWVRDGIPILEVGGNFMRVEGVLIRFKTIDGYQSIARFEPRSYYRWATVRTESGIEANVLVAAHGLTSDRGGGDPLDEPWRTANDPLFKFALNTVAAAIQDAGSNRLEPTDRDPESWDRYYRIQSSYLLACALLERIALLVVGVDSDVTARINKLGRKGDFRASVELVGLSNPGRRVFRSDDPTRRPVSLNHAEQFAQWAYQIRSNMVHRGKSSWREADLVRTALIDLHDVLRVYLLTKLPNIRQAWEQSCPEGSSNDWRIKPTP